MHYSYPLLMAVGIFSLAYGFIVSEKINKTLVTLLGAGILLILHIIPTEEAVKHIDVNVLFLLIFMMIIVNITEKSGFFEWLTIFVAKRVRAEPRFLMIALFCVTALLSAVLDNVTTILLVSPLSILLAAQLKISPIPFMITQVLGSNIGGTATLIGDPPNIMIGSAARLSFFDFVANLLPIILVQLFVLATILFIVFRKSFRVTALAKARVMEMDERKLVKDKRLLVKSLTILSLVVVGFLLHGWLEIEASVIAMLGAAALGIWTRLDLEELLLKVEWSTILFFIGLFVLVGALEYVGFIHTIADVVMRVSKGNMGITSQVLLWSCGILSGLIDNIPLTATFIPVIKQLGAVVGARGIEPLWWSLSLGACLGGNLTPIGASANVIMISIARKNGYEISFAKFLLYGIPVTILTLGLSSIYLLLRF